jgi:hypothetical protein
MLYVTYGLVFDLHYWLKPHKLLAVLLLLLLLLLLQVQLTALKHTTTRGVQ